MRLVLWSITTSLPCSARLCLSRPFKPFYLQRGYATLQSQKSEPQKPYYVTTPIFYVNAAPHIGHLHSMVIADVLKRWQLLKGRHALLCTGTDEHGLKIQRAAARAGCDPKVFCNDGVEVFKLLASKAAISNDFFVRTTDPDHRGVVEYVWTMLQERGHIYQSKHEGWYSVSDETFYPHSGVHLIQDPRTGRKMMTSMETGTEVEWTSESNYHFRLSAFQDRLLEFYREHPGFIVPSSRMDDVVQTVSAGLGDLSISRPVERLTWGIRVPGDETQTIYVWFDALFNYLIKAGYPWPPGQEELKGWPADCHVIGKDIVRFHCIYWPALLMALNVAPPKRILTHAHWTLGRKKMAKSTGNVVNPFYAIERFGPDTMRYYLARDGGTKDDADYDNKYIIRRYKSELQFALGNLANRVLRGRDWNVRKAILLAHEGNCLAGKALDEAKWAYLTTLAIRTDEAMEELNVSQALQDVTRAVNETNAFMQDRMPWRLAKRGDDHSLAILNAVIYTCLEALRICGILLQPFMPSKSGQLLDMLGVSPDKRSFEAAQVGADGDYGVTKVDMGSRMGGVLFPPLTSDF